MTVRRFAYAEKRQFHRMQVETPIEFQKADGQKQEGICLNLSATGMLLELDAAVEPGDVLQVLIPSPRPEFASLNSRVLVVRVEPGSQQGHSVGVEIQEMLR